MTICIIGFLITDCLLSLWDKLRRGATTEELRYVPGIGEVPEQYVFLDIPFNIFRIMSFLDDTAFRTTAPGRMTGHVHGYINDVQRSFYLGYFKSHGLKAQVLTLPNGMIGSIYLASICNSDSGLLNMNNLNDYIASLFE